MLVFPFGDDNVKGGYFPLFTYIFLAINVLVFLYEIQLSEPALASFFHNFGTIPAEVTEGHDTHTLFTNMFLHGGWAHLIGNMLFLWIFADNIEALVGSSRFFIFYILGGLVASFGHIWFNWDSTIPAVGASGAIAAIMGAYIVLFPQSRIKMLFLIFPFTIPAVLFLGFWIFSQVSSGVAGLAVETADTAGVAWWAHIIGFAFGVLGGLYWRMQGALKGSYFERKEIYV